MWKFKLAAMALTAAVMCTAAAPQAGLENNTPPRIVKLEFADGKVLGKDVQRKGGVGWIVAEQGEVLELRWSTDEHITLQLHGFNVAASLPKGTKSTMRLKAFKLGRFPVIINTLVSEVAKDGKEGKADTPTTNRRMPFFVEVLPAKTAAK